MGGREANQGSSQGCTLVAERRDTRALDVPFRERERERGGRTKRILEIFSNTALDICVWFWVRIQSPGFVDVRGSAYASRDARRRERSRERSRDEGERAVKGVPEECARGRSRGGRVALGAWFWAKTNLGDIY